MWIGTARSLWKPSRVFCCYCWSTSSWITSTNSSTSHSSLLLLTASHWSWSSSTRIPYSMYRLKIGMYSRPQLNGAFSISCLDFPARVIGDVSQLTPEMLVSACSVTTSNYANFSLKITLSVWLDPPEPLDSEEFVMQKPCKLWSALVTNFPCLFHFCI